MRRLLSQVKKQRKVTGNKMKSYKLNDGRHIPVLGFGTWKAKDGEEAYQAVKAALEVG